MGLTFSSLPVFPLKKQIDLSFLIDGHFIIPFPYDGKFHKFKLNDELTLNIPGKYSELVQNIEPPDDYEFMNIESFTEQEVYEGLYSIHLLINLKEKIEHFTQFYTEGLNIRTAEHAKEWTERNFSIYRRINFENPFLIWWCIPFTADKMFLESVFKIKFYTFPKWFEDDKIYTDIFLKNNYIAIQFLYMIYSPKNKISYELASELIFKVSVQKGVNFSTIKWMYEMNKNSHFKHLTFAEYQLSSLSRSGHFEHLKFAFNCMMDSYNIGIGDKSEYESSILNNILKCCVDRMEILEWIIGKKPSIRPSSLAGFLRNANIRLCIHLFDYIRRTNTPGEKKIKRSVIKRSIKWGDYNPKIIKWLKDDENWF